MASIPDLLHLRESSIETTAEFSNKLERLNLELKTHIQTLISQGEEKPTVGDIETRWANLNSNPLGPLAEMGMPRANSIINSKVAIFETLKAIKQLIKKKAEQNTNATKKIDSKWQRIIIEGNLAGKKLTEVPDILQKFITEVRSLDTI